MNIETVTVAGETCVVLKPNDNLVVLSRESYEKIMNVLISVQAEYDNTPFYTD